MDIKRILMPLHIRRLKYRLYKENFKLKHDGKNWYFYKKLNRGFIVNIYPKKHSQKTSIRLEEITSFDSKLIAEIENVKEPEIERTVGILEEEAKIISI